MADVLGPLSDAALELAAAEERVAKARARRDKLIVELAMETDLTYDEIGQAAQLGTTAVWKIAVRNGISRQRVQQLPEAASG